MRHNILWSMAVATLTILGACSSVTELDDLSNSKSNENTGSVSFKIGGSASLNGTTRAQTTEEQSVKTLYAAVFKTNSTSVSNNNESGSDELYEFINLGVESGNTISSSDLKIDLPAGNYYICFVANIKYADVEKIRKSDDSDTEFVADVAGFKSLITDTDFTLNTGLLMTSGFYGVKIVLGSDSQIGTVNMTRAMSRIDIVNNSTDVKITNVRLENQYTNTYIYSGTNQSNNGINSAFQDYDLEIGKGEAVNAAFYSYANSNLATVSDTYLEFEYEMESQPGTTFIKKLKFEKNGTKIPLERNKLYTVTMTSEKLTLDITCGDWDEASNIGILNNNQTIAGTKCFREDYSQAQVGDFMLDDGSIVIRECMTEAFKPRVVGMVALLKSDCPDLWKGSSSHGGFNHGLVLSSKNCGFERWSTDSSEKNYDLYSKFENMYDNSVDGYANFVRISSYSQYPAYQKIDDLRKSNSGLNTKTTNWYMPTVREMIEISRQLTTPPTATPPGSYTGSNPTVFLGDYTYSDLRTQEPEYSNSDALSYLECTPNCNPGDIIDKWLDILGNYSDGAPSYIWTSTLYTGSSPCYACVFDYWVYSGSQFPFGIEICYETQYAENTVRCILAF